MNQFGQLEIHGEDGRDQGDVVAQGEHLDGRDALDDGGVEREQRLVVQGHQEPELRVSLELKFCQSSFTIYHLFNCGKSRII